jgi:hypothetical protein
MPPTVGRRPSTVVESSSWDPVMHDRLSPSPQRPSVGEFLQELLPLIFFVPVAGPPAILLVGPLLLFVLLLIPAAALLITVAVVFLLGAGLLGALIALFASPYLLVRHLRARHPDARPTPAVSEAAGTRDGRPLGQPLGPALIDLTTR